MKKPFPLLFQYLFLLGFFADAYGTNILPVFTLASNVVRLRGNSSSPKQDTVWFQHARKARGFLPDIDNSAHALPFMMLIDKDKDTSEYWRETEILSLVRNREADIDYEKCEQTKPDYEAAHFASRRTVRPICRTMIDHQLCPQCPHFNNRTECELFRESCTERGVRPSEYRSYCDKKYGQWRSMFLPADYPQCRCCDECVLYRELDQSCMQDEYVFDADEFLPVTTIDFRAGCNPYWGHPEQEYKALRCDKVLRRCVPVSIPSMPNETLDMRRSYRFQPASGGTDCPMSCRGYECRGGVGYVKETDCSPGAFLPDKDQCNCCGRCSAYQQLNQKCAEFKKTDHKVNGTKEIEVEEEFLEPGCDDGLVCRQGVCQDIHIVETMQSGRRRREEDSVNANEPCKKELKTFKKKYGSLGHLHHSAPQCTPLWLYSPVQCRRFVCYCALEDGSFIEGIKVPRVEVSNMNCDCAREKCRTHNDVECDGYGNYKEAMFTPHVDLWTSIDDNEDATGVRAEHALPRITEPQSAKGHPKHVVVTMPVPDPQRYAGTGEEKGDKQDLPLHHKWTSIKQNRQGPGWIFNS